MDEMHQRARRPSWNGLMRVGGVALLVAALLYVSLLIAVLLAGGLPTDGAGMLAALASRTLFMQAVMVLFIVLDLCLLAALPGLYVALQARDRTWPVIAWVLAAVGLALDVVSGLLVLSLADLIPSYRSATGATRQAYGATAEFIYAYIWRIETPFFVALLSLAVVIFSAVMLRGAFDRRGGFVGIVLGCLGFVGGMAGFIPAVFLLIPWFVLTGIQLYRMGGHRAAY